VLILPSDFASQSRKYGGTFQRALRGSNAGSGVVCALLLAGGIHQLGTLLILAYRDGPSLAQAQESSIQSRIGTNWSWATMGHTARITSPFLV